MDHSLWRILVFTAIYLYYQQPVAAQTDATSTTVSQFGSTISLPWDDCSAESCEVGKNWTQLQVCEFTRCNDGVCEGGYFSWSLYAECTYNVTGRVFIIIGAVCYMLYLFVTITCVADEFFGPSVSAIVAHLKISESIAGVTFLAFGNGAPDVFGSIASVLSAEKPKADLALGDLLGGGCFVTMMVIATIVLTKPFKAEVSIQFFLNLTVSNNKLSNWLILFEFQPFAMTRDIVCYFIAIGWILFVFLYRNEVYIWEPLVYLGIYAIYVVIVFVGNHFQQKRRKLKHRKSKASRSSMRTGNSANITRANSVVPDIHVLSVPENDSHPPKRTSITFNNFYAVHPSQKLSPNQMSNGTISHEDPGVDVIIEDAERSSSSSSSEEEFVVSRGRVFTGTEARIRAASIAPPPMKVDTWRLVLIDVYRHFRPLSNGDDEWADMNIFSKVMAIVKIPIVFAFKLTIPQNELSWSKAVAVILAITCPQLLLFSIQGLFLFKLIKNKIYSALNMKPVSSGPGLFVYMFGVSAILIAIVLIFTRFDRAPKYYKEIYSYLGFLMSIAWIYWISAEVVSVVTMLGVISRIPHEVLGMTILAWSNSIGDLIADVSVVKQGYPRMAISAAIGGPLFNLLVGFGLPFSIARLQKKAISV
ncbi:hypothetical protein WR25_04691 isoform H [Diploscapter pachys]|uniref:Sodium/calcium exchanger membrane region domain-containing protein n=1 Tax=Diploscapter pachys TaxID=2018661 RepID=A0A2A2J6K1_9BILA|nr:hypothetical protein WR25_04691 isoform H [Diploscapter pachys]